MASITSEPNGRRTIQFKDTDGSRKSIRLGKCAMKTAQAIRTQVEHLAAAKASGTAIPLQATEWLKTIDDALRSRIANTGLIETRATSGLQEFLADYIASRTDAKGNTKTKWRITAKHLERFFGKDRQVYSITAGDAQEFRLHLLGRKLVENSVRSNMAVSKMLFNGAIRRKLIEANPFQGQKATTIANHSRFHFVTREDTRLLTDAAPDWQWRTIIALARYGGLRTPSETLLLRWEDIHWDRDRITVTSPKTLHTGKDCRQTPLFPELRAILTEAHELAEEKQEFVITRYRSAEQNLRTTLAKIAKRAGVQLWGKPFQNMRSTRETELVETYPIHVVTQWLGNSASVAAKHYLQVTEEHFEKAVQNPVQQSAASLGNAPLSVPTTYAKTPENAEKAAFPGSKGYPVGT